MLDGALADIVDRTRLPGTNAAMSARWWSSIRYTTWLCSNRRRGRWTRPRRWTAGCCRGASRNCADCSKLGSRSTVSREYVQVLRLMETFALAEVSHAIEDALLLGTISFDAVRHLLLCRIERRPPRLDMDNYPHLPMAQVRTTHAADYMTLLAEACA